MTSKAIVILTLASLMAAGLAHAQTEDGIRETLSSEGRLSAGKKNTETTFKRETDVAVMKKGTADRSQRKVPSADNAAVNQLFWVFDATTALLDDLDGDGFFTRLELTFDADTVFDSANVYAVLYLSLEGAPWVEYGETRVFDIYGSGDGDEYFFDSDLVSGFPTGYYDVLIELYDDFDGTLVATFGPDESADLFDLPLESQATDSVAPPVIVITDEGGGGSSGLWMLSTLIGLLALRSRRFRQRFAITQ